ncbi:FxLYD domain-containing protein [Streptomyces cinnabarinus]|uniref:FxLYD domain-containing protein n=1 Tax=Streptomyces cinnabarinus TaxID=67287 RepID=A0ABY7KH50_9ACTN|nr:FxLYD domain-containing protein [Streptomyces cinnabarinus]WAZ22990.1 FxLYD domain-containing protein [Streptomyces cinnabarinus]
MPGHRIRSLTLLSAVAFAASVALTGCSDDDTPSSVASSVASRVSEAAESLATEAQNRIDDIKNGVDAKDAVTLGDPVTDGRATVPVTVENTADSAKSFAVQVDFTDSGGNRLDVVVVTISDVQPGESKEATARSNRDLTGEVKAEVARAVRY